MPESFEVEAVIPATPERVYAAWLDTKEHGAFTGSPALVEPWIGGRFTAHDGYLHGINLQLEPGKRIVQSWRSTEFPLGCPDSHVYVDLEPVAGGTLIRLKHVDVPIGQTRLYKPGWVQRYFKPMVKYFAAKPPKAAKGAAAKASASPGASVPAAAKRAGAPAAKRPGAPKAVKRPAAKPRATASAAKRAPAKRPASRRPTKPARSKPARAKPAKSRSSGKKAKRKGHR